MVVQIIFSLKKSNSRKYLIFFLDFPKESCLWNALEAMFAQRQLNEQNCFIQHDFIISKDIPSRDAATRSESRYNQYTTEELIESARQLNEASNWHFKWHSSISLYMKNFSTHVLCLNFWVLFMLNAFFNKLTSSGDFNGITAIVIDYRDIPHFGLSYSSAWKIHMRVIYMGSN